jgi:tetratricopeptide (TPR) repeat protein
VLWRRALLLTDLGKTASEEDAAVMYYRRALEDADDALAADSTTAWPHAVKALVEGRLCLHVGKRERARRSKRVRHHAERALAHDSTLALAHHMLGRWHRHVADLNFFERTVADAIYGDLPEASFEASVRSLKQALTIQDRSYHHLHLAKTYRQMDREAAARRQLRKALNASGSPLDPEFKSEARSLLEEID